MSLEKNNEQNDKSQTGYDLNSIATIGAVILSIVAISISLFEVSTMRAQQRASVWPYLQIASSYSSDTFKIMLSNKGVGPALVKQVVIKVDDKKYSDFNKVIEKLIGPENAFSYDVYKASNPANSVLSAEEEFRLISVPLRKSDTVYEPGLLFAQQANEHLNISICYCSIMEECWISDIKLTGVVETKSCE